jgi:hypothetical protein
VMLLFSSIQLVSQVCGLGDHATRGMSQIWLDIRQERERERKKGENILEPYFVCCVVTKSRKESIV